MATRVVFLATILLGGVVGCDPRVGINMRQALVPVPQRDCLAAALSGAADVIEIGPLATVESWEGFWIVVRDPAARNGRLLANVTRSTLADSAKTVTIAFTWVGFSRPPIAEELSAVSLGQRLFSGLREACAPNAPSEVQCEFGSFRGWKPCRTAA